MAEKKITKVQKFEAIAKVLEGKELIVDGISFSVQEFCDHEVELIQKKASAKKVKVSDEALKMREDVLATLADGKGRTVTEVIKDTPALASAGCVPQKVTPVLSKLVKEEGIVTVEKVKGKSIYTLA